MVDRRIGIPGIGLVVVLVASLAATSAADRPAILVDPASLMVAKAAKERHEDAIMALEGVVGIGVGVSDTQPDQAVIVVFLAKDTPPVRKAIPATLDGVPVKVVRSGEFQGLPSPSLRR